MAAVDERQSFGTPLGRLIQCISNEKLSMLSPDCQGQIGTDKSDSDLSLAQTPIECCRSRIDESRNFGNSCNARGDGEGNPIDNSCQRLHESPKFQAWPHSEPFQLQIEKSPSGLLSKLLSSPTKKKKINGYHAVVDHNKTRISGMWKDSMLHGRAVLHFENGATFDGEFKQGLMDGYGEWIGPKGESYRGQWANSYTHGKGEFIWEDGNRYSGDWYWGIMWGNGKFTTSDGSVYEGQFADAKRHGHGKVTHKNGDAQYSIWYKDTKWITYMYQYANGDVYNRNGATKFSLDDKQMKPEKPPAPPKPEPHINPMMIAD